MSARYRFRIETSRKGLSLPEQLFLGRDPIETEADVLLKALAFLLYSRERLQVDARMDDDNIPYRADLVELDYSLRPVLWIECGDCPIEKLERLAVKMPDCAIHILKKSRDEAADLLRQMARARLRPQRYHVIGFDDAMFDEMLNLLRPRNSFFWVDGSLSPPLLQFDFNGLWFDGHFDFTPF